MVPMSDILDFARRIAEGFRPERIILFGSHAREAPLPGSDVDLLVIMPFEGKASGKSLEILRTTDPGFPVDLLVRTPQQIEQRLRWNDFFLLEVMEQGKVLYEAPHR